MFVEFLEKEMSYNVKKQNASGMEIIVNGIEYNKKENVLQRKSCEYNVTLHFNENKTSIIKEIQNVLKTEYINSKNKA